MKFTGNMNYLKKYFLCECTYLAINEEFFLLCCFVASGGKFEIQLARLSQVRLTEAYFESLWMGYLQPFL